MKRISAAIQRRTLQFRIMFAFVSTAALLALAVAIATLTVVRAVLEDQRVKSAQRQTLFALLFAHEVLETRPNVEQLVTRMQIRQRFDAMVTEDSQWYSTNISLSPDALPADLQSLVTREAFGYQFATISGDHFLIFGTPLPPAQTDMYLFFSLDDLDATMSALTRVMTLVGILAVAIVIVVARRVSRRVVRPLAAVSGAAQRIAGGLLETRLDEPSTDEVGQLATSFNRMAEALNGMIERERRFVAAVSHELRTPLSALHATTEVVATYRSRLPEDANEALTILQDDIRGLGQLVEELLEVSDLDSDRAVVRVEPIRVRSLIEAMLARRKVSVVVKGEDVTINSDKVRLERILGNLVDNALTHGMGADVQVSITPDDRTCSIRVSDQGPGIPPEEHDLLFTRFYKGDRSRTRGRGGVGLGLAIAYQNAILLGGRIEVDAGPGRGATFTVTLPIGDEGQV